MHPLTYSLPHLSKGLWPRHRYALAQTGFKPTNGGSPKWGMFQNKSFASKHLYSYYTEDFHKMKSSQTKLYDTGVGISFDTGWGLPTFVLHLRQLLLSKGGNTFSCNKCLLCSSPAFTSDELQKVKFGSLGNSHPTDQGDCYIRGKTKSHNDREADS